MRKSIDVASLLGELTDRGRETTLAFGERMRRLYVDQLKFLPPTFDDENILYIRLRVRSSEIDSRTSHVQRTVDSMAQVFAGLYPYTVRCAIPNFHIRLVNHENIFPNDDFCAYLIFGNSLTIDDLRK